MVDNNQKVIRYADTLSNPIIFGCQSCSYRWTRTFTLPIVLDAFVSRMKVEGICPKCGNKSKAFRKSILILGQYTFWAERDN